MNKYVTELVAKLNYKSMAGDSKYSSISVTCQVMWFVFQYEYKILSSYMDIQGVRKQDLLINITNCYFTKKVMVRIQMH